MAIRFTSEFRSDTGIDYKIEIDDSVFVGSPTTFVVGSEGFTLQYSGETDDIVSPIMSSNVSIPFMVQNVLQQTFFEQLVAVQESRFRIKISRWVSGSYKTYWVGYVMQDIAQIEDAPFPYIYELRAVDGLGRLANIDYTFANDVFQNSLALTRVNKMLFNCLSSVGTTDLFASTDTFFETCVNWWENNMVYSTTKDAANEIAVDRRIFSTIDDDGNETYSKVIEVLRQLCVSFGARVYQSNGRFVFEQYGERAAASRIVSTYDRAGAYIATASKSDDVVIDQTIGEARLAGNQFDFLPAIKRCEIEFEQKFVGARVAQLYFTFTRTTAQPIGFISEDSSAVLEIVCPMMHFNINRTPNTIVAVPSYAIAPIFAMTIKIEDVNNPGTFYYFQRTFNGFSATSPYSTPQWTTTPSDYQFDIGNFKFSPYGTAGLSSPVTIQTDQLPVSGELTFQLKQPTLRRVSNGSIYAQPPLYVGMIAGSSIKYDFLANINYISNGQLSPESIVYKASNNATGIDSNLVLELGKTSIADGPLQTGNLAIWNGSIWAGSDQWRKGNSGTYKKLLQLLVTEALALHAKPIRRYNGSFYSSHDISRRYTFDTFDWLFIGGSLNANNENVDGEFFAIARDVTNIVDVNSGLFVGDLAPMSVNKVSGPNSFGGVFNDGSIAGMLVDSDTFSVGPFSQPNPGEARITGTTTVDGDTFFTQDVDVTGDLFVDGTIVIDGLGDVATESWVIAQGYLTAESDTLDSVTDRGNVTTNTINVGGVTSDYVLFDTTATPTPSLGMAYWNTDEGTVSLQVNGVSYELGQKEAWIVKNQSGATITKGTVVMAVGALGASARILAGKMVADGSVSPRFILGVAAENIANGADGRVIHRGKLRQFNTSAFAVGDVLYCDPTTPGGFTNVEPQAPNLKLAVAFVLSSGTNGALAIRINAGNRLSEDHDVQLSTLSTGQLLRYNSNRWENWTPNFLTPSNVSGTTNYVSKFTGTNTVGNSQIFDNGTNVGIGTATPSYKLDVNGTFRSNAFFTLSNGVSYWGPNGSEYGYLTWDSGYAKVAASNTNTLYLGASNQITILSGGNVGIGTTSPSGKLNIAGVTAFNSGLNIDGNTANGVGMSLRNAGGNNWYIISTGSSNGGGANNLGFYNDNVGEYRLYVTSGGNVGIGTTSPNEKLTVIGKVYAIPYLPVVLSGNGSPQYGTNITMASDTGATQGAVRIWSKYDGSGNAAMTFERATTTQVYNADPQLLTYSESMRISGNGNVGIGTTSPGAKLDVVGNTYIRSGILYVDTIASYSTTNVSLASATNLIVPSGNVGIGTTSPASRLHVETSASNPFRMVRTGGSATNFGYEFGSGAIGLYDYTNSTYRYYITSGGNVGIGTSSPATRLHVDASGHAMVVSNDSGNRRIYFGTGGTGEPDIQATLSNGTARQLSINAAGGNVGIGTTSPGYKLEVNGTGRFNGELTVVPSSTNGVTVSRSGGYASIYGSNDLVFETDGVFYFGVYTPRLFSVNSSFYTTAAGNVGIGTTSPSDKLHIVGDINVGAYKVYNGSSNNSAGFELNGSRFNIHGYYGITFNSSSAGIGSQIERMRINPDGNVGIGTTSPTYKFNVVSNAVAGKQNLAAIDRTAQNFVTFTNPQYSTNASMGLLLRVFPQSDARQGAGIIASGGSNNATTDLDLFVTTSPDGLGGTSYSAIKINGLNGNVGIGTTSPGQKLSVEGGSIQLNANNAASNYYLILNKKSGQDGGVLFNRDNSGDWQLSNNASSGDLIFYSYGTSSEAITFKKASGNVGIGTTNPGSLLQVGKDNTTTNSLVRLGVNYDASRNSRGGIDWHDSSNVTGKIHTEYDGTMVSMVFGSLYNSAYNSNSLMVIRGNGNVGIGTTSPSDKLHVYGGRIVLDHSLPNQSAIQFNQGGTEMGVLYRPGGVSNQLRLFMTGAGDVMTWNSSGNVGIGTTSPVASLDVRGAGNAVHLQSTSNDVWQTFKPQTGNTWRIQAQTSNNFGIYDENASSFRFLINSSGNVGIGTTSPGSPLHVYKNDTYSAIISRADWNSGTSTKLALGKQYGVLGFISSDLVETTNDTSYIALNYKNSITTYAEGLRVYNNGNVGIGTTSPGASLHVAGAINSTPTGDGFLAGIQSGYAVIHLNGSAATGSLIDFSVSGTDTKGRILYDNINNYFGFNTNGAERLKITSTGDVGIGTSSPSAKLHVIGNATVSATLSTANAKISGTLADSFNQVGTAGQILSSTGTGIEWITGGGGGGGSTIAVKDEGVSIGSSFTTLDFQGNNIQATASGSTAVITAFNNAGTGSMYVDAVTTNYTPGATFGDVEIDSSIIFAASPDAATGSSKLIATVTFGVENVSSFDEFNSFEFRLYDVSQSIVVSNTTHTWTGYMSKNENATTTVFTFHIPLDTDVAPGDEIRVQAKQAASITPEIYYCAITLMEGTV